MTDKVYVREMRDGEARGSRRHLWDEKAGMQEREGGLFSST
jgi:hypothetical protein